MWASATGAADVAAVLIGAKADLEATDKVGGPCGRLCRGVFRGAGAGPLDAEFRTNHLLRTVHATCCGPSYKPYKPLLRPHCCPAAASLPPCCPVSLLLPACLLLPTALCRLLQTARTPLLAAGAARHVGVVAQLLKAGANREARDPVRGLWRGVWRGLHAAREWKDGPGRRHGASYLEMARDAVVLPVQSLESWHWLTNPPCFVTGRRRAARCCSCRRPAARARWCGPCWA